MEKMLFMVLLVLALIATFLPAAPMISVMQSAQAVSADNSSPGEAQGEMERNGSKPGVSGGSGATA